MGDGFLDDLDAELAFADRADARELQAEEERLRVARLGLRDRIVGMARDHDGRGIRIDLRDRTSIVLAPERSGRDWVSGRAAAPDGAGTFPCVVPMHAIRAIVPARADLPASLAATGPGEVGDRLGLGAVLRDLCRRRAAVTIASGGQVLHGTIDRVGRDHLDLAVHEPGTARRDADVRQVRIVPFAEVDLVRW